MPIETTTQKLASATLALRPPPATCHQIAPKTPSFKAITSETPDPPQRPPSNGPPIAPSPPPPLSRVTRPGRDKNASLRSRCTEHWSLLPIAEPVVDADYLKEIAEACRYLRAFIYGNNCALDMLPLAYFVNLIADGRVSGNDQTIRNVFFSRNNVLRRDLNYLESVKFKFPKISYADFYQLAGYVAAEVTGGPSIDFVPGRRDSKISPKEGQLPGAEQGFLKEHMPFFFQNNYFSGVPHLREVFYRMGLSDRDIVALSVGQALDALLYVEGGYRAPVDNVVLDGLEFCPYVELYAKDKEAFFKDYAASHKKL